jgi:hypothetical protein
MTQAVAYGEAENGQQSTSSGLILHRGPLNAALVRAVGSQQTGQVVWPRDGQGSGSSLELAHYPKQSSNVQSYDRDTSQWLDLNLYGKNISLNPQGGKLIMPAGSAQAVLGYWFQGSGWAVPAINQWYETDVRVNFTTTGSYPLRFDWNAIVYANTVGTAIYIGVGYDGTLQWASCGIINVPGPGYQSCMSGVVINQSPLAVGAHRVSLWMYANTAGAQFSPNGTSALWVTEIRA